MDQFVSRPAFILDQFARNSPDTPLRGRAKRLREPIAWGGFGPIRSLRGSLLTMTILAIAPLVLFASTMALVQARDTQRLATAAAWVTVAALPVLIGVAAVLIVSIALEALVMQWLSYLERLSHAYARGRYSVRPIRLQRAPAEFRALGEAVEAMASGVEHRDHALRDALDEQTVLLREVHHRVKNNLQIVGSLLSLQAARADDPAVKAALQDALVRIDAMSLGQRFMQQQEGDEQVGSVELFETFLKQARARLGGGRRNVEFVLDVEPFTLSSETGSRLAMVAAEALLCTLHGTADPVQFTLTVRQEPQGVMLRLGAPGHPDVFCEGERVSHDLIDGYVRQLRGRLETPEGSAALVLHAPMSVRPPDADESEETAPGAQGMRFFRVLDRTHGHVAS